jgi:hypothetical protein
MPREGSLAGEFSARPAALCPYTEILKQWDKGFGLKKRYWVVIKFEIRNNDKQAKPSGQTQGF